MPPPPEAQLNYRLPSTIQSIQDGWQQTSQSVATISALLAVVSALLMIPTQYWENNVAQSQSQRDARLALTVLSYASLILNISACLSSFILIDELGEIPFRAASKRHSALPVAGAIQGTPDQLLRRYGAGNLWNVVVLYWFISFISALFSMLAQIGLYVWTREERAVQIAISCLLGFAALPILFICTIPCISKRGGGTGTADIPRMRHSSAGSGASQPFSPEPLPIPPNVSSFTLPVNALYTSTS